MTGNVTVADAVVVLRRQRFSPWTDDLVSILKFECEMVICMRMSVHGGTVVDERWKVLVQIAKLGNERDE